LFCCNLSGIRVASRNLMRDGRQIRSYLWLAIPPLCIVVIGCNRSATPAVISDPSADSATKLTSQAQELPFHRADDYSEGISPSESLVPLPHRVPAGTAITIRLQSGVSSANAHSGDVFEAVLDEPIVVGGQTIVPRGAQVAGRVVAAKASGRLQDPGYLRLALATITVRGKSIPVQSSSISIEGKSHEKHNWESIGGGAAAGAIIGGLAGGGKGALVGTTVGGAGGTGLAYATGKKNVGFGAERRLTFRLIGALDVKG